ncbi:MAG: LLM class flavin-dependent oxidoreductase [Dehalococcoidia bacterium]
MIGNTYRHPAVLANIAATIDHVSGGRLEWGIGAGWWQMEHEEYGIPFHHRPPHPALAEAAKIQKLLWTEHRADFAGRYYQLTEALCEPKPVQNRCRCGWAAWANGTLRVVAEVGRRLEHLPPCPPPTTSASSTCWPSTAVPSVAIPAISAGRWSCRR